MEKIFVSVASYRDPELIPTLKDMLANAAYPDSLTICVGWQHSEEDAWDNLQEQFGSDPRFIIINVPHQQAKGVCWMRSEIQRYWSGEEYYLQLDSHHRFDKNWDRTLKDTLNYLRVKGHDKPVLSSYMPGYFPNNDPEGRNIEVWGLNIQRFMPNGVIFLEPHRLKDWEKLQEPVPSRFISAHMIFTLGKFVKEVPYDPELYFHGEESSLAARAYTYGYDLFCPHKPVIWHEYTRSGKKKHWDDSKEWSDRDKASYNRYRKLMGVEKTCSSCERNRIAPSYFGKERSFQDYEIYAGLKFSTSQIHKETLKNEFPPLKSDYESGLTDFKKYCIDVYRGSLPEKDYESLVVAFLDKDGNDIYRKDADESEIELILNSSPEDQFVHIWREFQTAENPHSSRVWPKSKSKGWCDRIEQVINHE